MDWGLLPSVYDQEPYHYQKEMFKFYQWKLTRAKMLNDVAQLNSKYFSSRR